MVHNFSSLLSDAWTAAMTARNIMSRFHTTGVYPLDRSAGILPTVDRERDRLDKISGLAYIPLYTPSTEGPATF